MIAALLLKDSSFLEQFAGETSPIDLRVVNMLVVSRGNQLAVSNEISTNLHLTRLRWVRNTEGGFFIINTNVVRIGSLLN